ncbi:hypothetical protein GCM10011352_29970 [Marinobacterium zhoushanense]|uniref:DUF411 domain-containing protein n=1 Tax=Marinobacterium zhoushanense TaxID=1679163 RepID=A0ABQ1KKB2_9GAMM|nr:DUF411 domain-containing protein [Marinobacterium zhoushanense]GGC01812.1 hypothetical protein GCM10011352_29970 [Marinobacterium zhoushanense]
MTLSARHYSGTALLCATLFLSACSESSATDTKSPVADAQSQNIELDVYKSPTCGCCTSWVEHAQTHGFASSIHHPDNLNGVKDEYGIPANMRSCHTSVSKEGYVFEGHVPAKLVKRFLTAPPEGALGLAVPGMPAGSPGMEMGDRFQAYPVVLLNKDGSFQLYEKIDEQDQQY